MVVYSPKITRTGGDGVTGKSVGVERVLGKDKTIDWNKTHTAPDPGQIEQSHKRV